MLVCPFILRMIECLLTTAREEGVVCQGSERVREGEGGRQREQRKEEREGGDTEEERNEKK